jgi:hypothetical protein
MRITIKLTGPQLSAMECRDWSDEDAAREAWKGDRLEFDAADAPAIYSDLTDAANSEDAARQLFGDVPSGRASRALQRVASNVIHAVVTERAEV